MKNTKEIAKKLKAKYKLYSPGKAELMNVARDMGYSVVSFSPMYNSDSVKRLIAALGVSAEIAKYKAFTYVDSHYRIIFVTDFLSDDESRILLAHEIGHIACGHMTSAKLSSTITSEWEANEFSHYLLTVSPTEKLHRIWCGHRLGITIACSSAAALICAVIIFSGAVSKSDVGGYYVTPSGSKYHRENCIYIKNNADSRKITKDELKKYSPCKICLPDKQK